MLTGTPDRTLGLSRLEHAIHSFRSKVSSQSSWYFREAYIDRNTLDPYYILQFKKQVEDQGDDLYDQQLFATAHPHLNVVNMTREKQDSGYQYWRTISNQELDHRLERFLKMYREDYLQPPGNKGDVFNPDEHHELFKEKRFIYEIRSGSKGLIGVGPKMYAGLGIGAIRGLVIGEDQKPLVEVIVELVTRGKTLARKTDKIGQFWFSKVPPGKHRIRVRARSCMIQVIEEEYFGNVKGWLTDQDGNPVSNSEVQLIAPDAETFLGFSDTTGKFTTGPLPAFPYILRIPDHLFSIEKTIYVCDAIIGGTLKAQDGSTIADQSVVLKQQERIVKEVKTDPKGRFLFDGLAAGSYRIEVPGKKIFVREVSGGHVDGRMDQSNRNTELFLVVADRTIGWERTSKSGAFEFRDVVPGKYRIGG